MKRKKWNKRTGINPRIIIMGFLILVLFLIWFWFMRGDIYLNMIFGK